MQLKRPAYYNINNTQARGSVGHPIRVDSLMAWCTYPRKETLVYQQLPLHQLQAYTTVTPHSDSRSDHSAYVTSHIQYTSYV